MSEIDFKPAFDDPNEVDVWCIRITVEVPQPGPTASLECNALVHEIRSELMKLRAGIHLRDVCTNLVGRSKPTRSVAGGEHAAQ